MRCVPCASDTNACGLCRTKGTTALKKDKNKNKSGECCADLAARRGRVGGSAVLEGVMMKAGDRLALACRTPKGEIALTERPVRSVREKYKILNLPIIRGAVNFVEMMILSLSTMNLSAEVALSEDENGEPYEEGRFTRWAREKLHVNINDIITVIAGILGVALAVLLFIWLPAAVSGLIERFFELPPIVFAVIEGGIKIAIFIVYLALVSLMPDIKRTFQYHGAEHKSIACYEAGGPLTPEEARKHTRFHPRCGTSFMFVMILLGVIVGFFIPFRGWIRTVVKLLILPIVCGVGYEFIRFAGKHDGWLVRALSAPGLWMQRITTKEPTDDQLEIAITSLKYALRDEFPELDPADYVRFESDLTEEERAARKGSAKEGDPTEATEAAEAAEPAPTDEPSEEAEA